MSLKTRLDARSKENASFLIKDASGKVVAEIGATSDSVTLNVSTSGNYFIEKPSGWKSGKTKEDV